MAEKSELKQKVPPSEYKRQIPKLRTELLAIQEQLQRARFPTIILFGGVVGAGKSETINLLNEWMDPRGITTRAFDLPSEEERERPEYWRYWLSLPPKGNIGMYLNGWYSRPLHDQAYGPQTNFEHDLKRITAFEQELVDDGALLLKFWIHLSKKAQEKRLRELAQNPLTRWRVTKREKENWQRYDQLEQAADQLLRKTSTAVAAWQIVAGSDPNYRNLTIASSVRDAIRHRLAAESSHSTPAAGASDLEDLPRTPNVLTRLDMKRQQPKQDYKILLEQHQGRLYQLVRRAYEQRISTILVFEGVDAAGKGGAIRRLTAALDAYAYQVIPIAAPSDEEHAQHYLWRFWRYLPRAGRVVIFDRSWYGRVLVERIEGYASEMAWKRAYREINDFEEQLVDHGMLVAKFWIHIDKEQQLKRFKARQVTPYKRWKMTDEDWRNRDKWNHYEAAVDDMVTQTSTPCAPWTLVEGNDKRFARIKVIKTLCQQLQKVLD